MNNKIKEEINRIPIPKELHKRSKIGILEAKSEMQSTRFRFSKILPYIAMVAVLAILLPIGFSQFNHHSPKTPTKSGKVKSSHKVSQTENAKNIQTYLRNELTGPSEELKNILKEEDFAKYAVEWNQYIDKNYKDLIPEKDYETFVNTNEALRWLVPAYHHGYQLKPKNIEIKKVENYNAYSFKVEVEYSKDGETHTATVTGYINVNDKGQFSAIRDIDDGGLLKNIILPK